MSSSSSDLNPFATDELNPFETNDSQSRPLSSITHKDTVDVPLDSSSSSDNPYNVYDDNFYGEGDEPAPFISQLPKEVCQKKKTLKSSMSSSSSDLNPFATDELNPFETNDSQSRPLSSITHKDTVDVPLDSSSSSDNPYNVYDDNFYGEGDEPAPFISQLPKEVGLKPMVESSDEVPEYEPDNAPFLDTGKKKTTTRTSSNRGAARRVYVSSNKKEDEYSVWQVEYYKEFFNVDTSVVAHRCLRSLIPIKPDFLEHIKLTPDFYGPLWIATSIIFLLAAAANFERYLADPTGYSFQFKKMAYGSAVIYGYQVFVPTSFYLYLKWVDSDIRYIELMCVYGYSLFIYAPVSILCVIPIHWLNYVFCGIGGIISSSFLSISLYRKLHDQFIILLSMAVIHLGLAVTFALYFFTFQGGSIPPVNGTLF
eukprot:TRINITY_DN402_c0_g2_i1.p1 TRINITY_DN402_c0_g2~~TRINITY_DN402_c0_g2_i1.p1  ORF type:complete len:442 (-),score=62.11 TRINITY_DN402_c0_g2_i1:27-1301(-)